MFEPRLNLDRISESRHLRYCISHRRRFLHMIRKIFKLDRKSWHCAEYQELLRQP